MIDRRHEIDDVFWLQRYDAGEGYCFKAEGSMPEWNGENWEGSSTGDTKWYYVTYEALEQEYGIDFFQYMSEETQVLLEVAIQNGDVIGTRQVGPPPHTLGYD